MRKRESNYTVAAPTQNSVQQIDSSYKEDSVWNTKKLLGTRKLSLLAGSTVLRKRAVKA